MNLNLYIIFECQRHIREFFVAWQICCREGGPSSQSLGAQLGPVNLSTAPEAAPHMSDFVLILSLLYCWLSGRSVLVLSPAGEKPKNSTVKLG